MIVQVLSGNCKESSAISVNDIDIPIDDIGMIESHYLVTANEGDEIEPVYEIYFGNEEKRLRKRFFITFDSWIQVLAEMARSPEVYIRESKHCPLQINNEIVWNITHYIGRMENVIVLK